jgi:ATP-binding cassette subfamily B protein/subfamily B ATP-binding cassette protein MsbA
MKKRENLRLDTYKKLSELITKKKLFSLLFFIKLLGLASAAILPLFYKILVDDVLINKDIFKLILVCIGYLIIFGVDTILVVVNKIISNKIFLPFTLNLQTKMLYIFTKMPAEKYEQYNSGDLKNRVDNDVNTCVTFLSTQLVDYIFNWLNALVFAVILCFINLKLSLFGFIMIPLSFLLTKVLGKKSRLVASKYREEWGQYEGYLQNTMQNWREIKSNSIEKLQEKHFTNYWEVLSQQFVKRQIYWYLNRAFIAFKDFFVTKMNLYFFGGLLIFSGEMTVGSLLVFMVYYEKLFSNIGAINELDIKIHQDIPMINKVIDILDIKINNTPIKNIDSINDVIEFNNVHFSYDKNNKEVLKDISFRIEPKERVAIVGRSGCGKTTLIKLLLKVYEPTMGSITIGELNLKELEQISLHKKVGIVMQEPYMFNLSIRENLMLAKPSATEEDLLRVCKKAYIDDFINSLPNGFDTIIGERGIKLSGGQKQRLAIARALLLDTEVLIFDEATSALDYESEKMIHKAIDELYKEKTIIIIAHRLSSIIAADKIVVLEDGKTVGIGKYEELLKNNLIFDKLFKEQASA